MSIYNYHKVLSSSSYDGPTGPHKNIDGIKWTPILEIMWGDFDYWNNERIQCIAWWYKNWPNNAIFLWKVFLWIIHPHGMNTSHLIPIEQVTTEICYLENLILFWKRFRYMHSHWILQKEYTKSPNQSSWKYIPLIAGLTRPMWMMCDPCHNYWDAVVINSILAELKTRFFRNLPFLSFVFSGMPYFGLFTHLKFSGFDGNIW